MHTSSISAGGSLPARGEARCNTPETPTEQLVLSQSCGVFVPTLQSFGEVAINDVIDTNDLHAVRSKCLLDSGDFDGASSAEERRKPGSGKNRDATR